MNIKIFQTGWNYSQDGPGNRIVLHFQGCNFDCPWCSNPEGQSLDGELMVHQEFLIPDVCPYHAISGKTLNRDLCNRCEDRPCLHKLRNKGISLSCRTFTIQDLARTACNSRTFFHDGGGVTLSGGEATVQFEESLCLLKKLSEKQINTALETNGSHVRLPELFPFLNHLIFDIKHWDFSKAEPVIRHNGRSVLHNLETAARQGVDLLLRITLIPGFNDSPEDAEQFVRLFKTLDLGDKCRLELLSYHEYGRSKWDSVGREYKMKSSVIKEENKDMYRNKFITAGFQVVQT